MTHLPGFTPVPLAHSESGSGRLAVLLHGITEDHRSFDPLLPLLEQHYRVLTVDLRGHGASPGAASYGLDAMAADVAAVVASAGGDGVNGDGTGDDGAADGVGALVDRAPLLIGHSLGGIVATAYAAMFPVRAVVNIDQPLDLSAMQGQIQAVGPLLRGDGYAAVIGGIFAQMYGTLPQPERDRLERIRKPVQSVLLGIWAPLLEFAPEELAQTVDTLVRPASPHPYLFIQGLPTAPDYPAWLQERIPGAVIDDWGVVGHYPHLCDPGRFLATVLAHDPAI